MYIFYLLLTAIVHSHLSFLFLNDRVNTDKTIHGPIL